MKTKTFEILSALDPCCWRHDDRLKVAESLMRMHPRDAWSTLLSQYPDEAVWLWEMLDLGPFPLKCVREVAARATAWMAAEAGMNGLATAIMVALENNDRDGLYWALNDVWSKAPSHSALSGCAREARAACGGSLGAECISAVERAVRYSMTDDRGCVLVFNILYERTMRDLVAEWAMWLFDEGYRIDISRA